MKGPKLTPTQWKLLSGAFSNISQAIILFALAAIFVPEVVSLTKDFSRAVAVAFLAWGLIILAGAVIIVRRVR